MAICCVGQTQSNQGGFRRSRQSPQFRGRCCREQSSDTRPKVQCVGLHDPNHHVQFCTPPCGQSLWPVLPRLATNGLAPALAPSPRTPQILSHKTPDRRHDYQEGERSYGGRPWNRTRRGSPRGSYSPLPHLAARRPHIWRGIDKRPGAVKGDPAMFFLATTAAAGDRGQMQ